MPSSLDTIKTELSAMLIEQLKATGSSLKDDLDSVRAYAAERMAHLATCVGQPGYLEAVEAEAQNVAMEAAARAIDQADAADARAVAIIQGALAIGSKALTLAV